MIEILHLLAGLLTFVSAFLMLMFEQIAYYEKHLLQGSDRTGRVLTAMLALTTGFCAYILPPMGLLMLAYYYWHYRKALKKIARYVC